MIMEFIVFVLGCTTIGTFWFGTTGTIIGMIIGLLIFFKYKKKKENQVDYNKIRDIIRENKYQ